jgi:transposase InsO family protein/transposase-like protein
LDLFGVSPLYSYEDRIRAVKLYIKLGRRAATTVRLLGYPSKKYLYQWYLIYKDTGDLPGSYNRPPKYTNTQKQKMLEHYFSHGECFAYTQRVLGYPCAHTFSDWLNEYLGTPEQTRIANNQAQAKSKLSYDKKKKAVIELCLRQSSAASIANKFGVSREMLYKWKQKFLSREYTIDMPKKKRPHKSEEHGKLQEQVEDLQQRMYQLQLEHDILKKANDQLKKDQGVNPDLLTNKEKTNLIDALLDTYRLNELLDAVGLPKSSYFYHKARMKLPEKYAESRVHIKEIFNSNWQCYGYRRIRVELCKSGQYLAEKVIRRLMKEEDLVAHSSCKRRRYNSYYGEISPPADNIIQRNFQATVPNKKWLTDISEFRIPAGKVYLSPIVDCFDGLVVSWKVGVRPTAQLVNGMLDEAISSLHSEEQPIVHSDRGAHYRWPGWINRMSDAQLTRSMSRKGCSPDNAACEGFFGRLKTEFFYPRDWSKATIEELMSEMNKYIQWYNQKRIKISLGSKSPTEHRLSLGYVT